MDDFTDDLPSLDKLLEYVSSEPRGRTNRQIETPPKFLFIVSAWHDFFETSFNRNSFTEVTRLLDLFCGNYDCDVERSYILTTYNSLHSLGVIGGSHIGHIYQNYRSHFIEEREDSFRKGVTSDFSKLRDTLLKHSNYQLVFTYVQDEPDYEWYLNKRGIRKLGEGTELSCIYCNDIQMFILSTEFPEFSKKMFLNTSRSQNIFSAISKTNLDKQNKLTKSNTNQDTENTSLPSIEELRKRREMNPTYCSDAPEYVLVPINTTASETIFRFRHDIRLYQVNVLNYLGYFGKVIDVLKRFTPISCINFDSAELDELKKTDAFESVVHSTIDDRVMPYLSVVRAENPTSKLVFCYEEDQPSPVSGRYDKRTINATLSALSEHMPDAVFLNLSRDNVRPIIDKAG